MNKILKNILAIIAIAGVFFPTFAADDKTNHKAEYDKLFSEYNIAFQNKDYDKMDALMPKIISFSGKNGIPKAHDITHNLTVCLTWRNEVRNNQSLKKAYELTQPILKGDDLVFWLQRYADFLKEKRLAKAEDIKKVLDQRYAVKDVSKRKVMECLIADGNFSKAETMIPAVLSEDTKRKPKEKYRDMIALYSKKGLPAAKITKRLYEEYLNTLTGDTKADVMGQYATFLKEYALADDAAVEKIYADRYNVAGLSDKMRMKLYFSEFSQNDESRFFESMKKAKELSRKSPELANQYYSTLAGIYNPPWCNRKAYKEDILMLFQDFPTKNITGWTIHTMRNFIVGIMGVMDYQFTLDVLKKCADSPDKNRQCMAYSVMADFYRRFAERMYDTPDVVQLHRAIICQEKCITLLDPAKPLERRDIINARCKIASYAILCKEYNTVREQVKLALQLNPESEIVKYAGIAAYHEGNYEEAVKILKPFADKRIRDGEVAECMVRSLCALKRYKEADELMPYMIENNYRSGKSAQYGQERRHLKIRVQEQEKVQNKK